MRRHTHFGCFVREPHHTAERALLANPHYIVFAFLEWLCLPTHYMCIEVNCLLRILGQLLIPNEPSVIYSHIRHFDPPSMTCYMLKTVLSLPIKVTSRKVRKSRS